MSNKNTKLLRLRLKSKEQLEKEGKIYSQSSSNNSFVLTDGNSVFKQFDPDCFQKVYTVADSEKLIDRESYEALKDLFDEVE